jgi:simple sugar transport system ATP-binding protein
MACERSPTTRLQPPGSESQLVQSAPQFSLRGVTKRYGAVHALAGIDLDIHAGDVIAICGDNGAGKSTLIKIMCGAEIASSGEIALAGRRVSFRSPHDALAQGVATIYQDLALAPRLSIAANVFMGAELTRPLLGRFVSVLDKPRMAEQARAYLKQLAIDIEDMSTPVERLSGGQRQAVAISRALRWNAKVIIMDEPTAALGVRETAVVLDLIPRLRETGHTIVLISHNMADVVAVATRVAILKSGRKVYDSQAEGLTAGQLASLVMSGGK